MPIDLKSETDVMRAVCSLAAPMIQWFRIDGWKATVK